MSKLKSFFAFFCLLISFSFIFTACSQKDSRAVVFENEFLKGNVSTFGTYGTIIDNEDKTITLLKSTNNVGPITYFGNSESKNSIWVDRGLTCELVFELKPAEIEIDDCFDWTFAVNNKEYNQLSQVVVSFRKFDKGLRVGFSQKSSEASNLESTKEENEKSKVIEKSGDYILQVSFYSNIKNEILFNIILTEKSNDEDVFVINGEKLLIADDNQIKTEEMGGIRSAGLSYMTLSSLKVKKVRLLEN